MNQKPITNIRPGSQTKTVPQVRTPLLKKVGSNQNQGSNPRPLPYKKAGATSNIKSQQKGGRTFRNLLEEKREQALKDYIYQRRVRRGLASPKRQKKRTLPLIPPKSVLILLKSKNKVLYDRQFVDYKNRGLLQEYISYNGKILPRSVTGITSKQQRYLTKAIKTARILGLLPFVKKEKGFFR